jgi:hypothetical protein
VASGGTGVSTSTGTTNVVLSNSPTIVTPVIAQINDASGNETLKLASIASAVNEISIENAATGNPVHIRATGGDASVGLHLVAKGASGYVNVTDGVDETKRIMFNAAGGTTNTRTMLSSTQTVDRTISLPDATGTLLYGGGPLGTPSSGTVTNLTGTASININGTVGATTASTGAFTTLSASGATTIGNGSSQNSVFDLIVGSADATTGDNSGVVVVNNATGKGWIGFNNANNASIPGQVTYDHSTNTLALVANGVATANVTSTGLAVTGTLSATGIISQTPNAGDPSYKTELVTAYNGADSFRLKVAGATFLRINTNDGVLLAPSGLAVTGALSSTTGANFATSGGNVGIGTTSPASRLHILGAGTSSPILQLTTTGTGNREFRYVISGAGANYDTLFIQGNTASGGTNFDTLVAINASGNVGIGTTSTIDIGKISLLFDASSQNGISVKSSSATYNNNLMSFVNAGGSQVGYIYTNGTITTYSGTSDYRLKDITGPLIDSGAFIDALKPKVGTWKSDGSKFVGFLAHEFAEVSPSSVNGEKDAVDAEGNPKYQGMQAGTAEVIANLVAEIQELRKRMAAVEGK